MTRFLLHLCALFAMLFAETASASPHDQVNVKILERFVTELHFGSEVIKGTRDHFLLDSPLNPRCHLKDIDLPLFGPSLQALPPEARPWSWTRLDPALQGLTTWARSDLHCSRLKAAVFEASFALRPHLSPLALIHRNNDFKLAMLNTCVQPPPPRERWWWRDNSMI